MKKLLALLTAAALISGCSEKTADSGLPDTATVKTEEETISETTEFVEITEAETTSAGTLWETVTFTMRLKDGWEISGEESAYYGDKAELNTAFMTVDELAESGVDIPEGAGDDEILKKVGEYFANPPTEQDIENLTQEAFLFGGKDGLKIEYGDDGWRYIGYCTIADGRLYFVAITVYPEFDGDTGEFDDMARTFVIKPLSEDMMIGYFEKAKIASLNATARSLSNELNSWLVRWDGKGYAVKRNANVTFEITVNETGKFHVVSTAECFVNPPDNPDDDLCSQLGEMYPNMQPSVIRAVLSNGFIIGALYCEGGEFPDVYWDADTASWVADGAQNADGVDRNGVMFGSYPQNIAVAETTFDTGMTED